MFVEIKKYHLLRKKYKNNACFYLKNPYICKRNVTVLIKIFTN